MVAYSEEKKVLVLQGGGALGAYQAGAYEALMEAGHVPSWVAGTSIGAINGAIIAGNQPDQRVAAVARLLGAGFQSSTGMAVRQR
jgi:NTE family protein